MYPFIRMIKDLWLVRNQPPIGITDTHVSHHICMPWDLDMWLELNNGRTLTLYDLGRLPLAARTGLISAIRKNRWGLTMAGAVVRYRRRIRLFERIEMRSRGLCWDDRFLYIEQSMWKSNGECANHVVYRSAVTDRNGIVSPARVLEALGQPDAKSPEFPEWVSAWLKAEELRPWPPMTDSPQMQNAA